MILWPGLGKSRHLTDLRIALGLLALTAPVSVTAFVWPRLRKLTMRPWLIVGLVAGMGAAYTMLPAMPWPWVFLPLLMLGVGSAGLFYHTVFYSNGDVQNPGHSIGMSELMVGLGGVLGPLAMGALAWNDAASWRPYAVGAAFGLAGALVVAAVWRGMTRSPAGSQSLAIESRER